MKTLTQAMQNPFPYSDTNRRFYTYDYYLRHTYGGKVAKIPLDAGFTCPNLDGTRGVGGCIYCSSRGSGDFAPEATLSVTEQFRAGVAAMSDKWKPVGYIPYFQAHTNTYAPVDRLRALWEEAIAQPGVVGRAVATRADCISSVIADLLRELAARTRLTVELGLQTANDRTAALINRCHTFEEFLRGYHLLDGLDVCIHLIEGLPGESRADMLETARAVAALRPFAVKLHLLHVLKDTALADLWESGSYTPMELADYVQIVCDTLELLPPETVVERITGDGPPDLLLAPLWSRQKFVVMNEIDKELHRRGSYQGKHWQSKTD